MYKTLVNTWDRDYTQDLPCTNTVWANIFFQRTCCPLCPVSVYFRLSASFGSLCHRFTFYICLILAITFAAYPPVIAFLQPRWQRNYSYLRFNCPCSLWTAAGFLNRTPSQSKHNVLCFSSAVFLLDCSCVCAVFFHYAPSTVFSNLLFASSQYMLHVCHVCMLWSGQRPRDHFLSGGPMSNHSPNLPCHLSLAAPQGHCEHGPEVSWG